MDKSETMKITSAKELAEVLIQHPRLKDAETISLLGKLIQDERIQAGLDPAIDYDFDRR